MKRIILIIIMLLLIIMSFQKPKEYVAGKKTAILPAGEYNTYPGCKFTTNVDPIDVFSSYHSSLSSWISTDYDGDGTWEKYGFGDVAIFTSRVSQCGSSLEHCNELYITAQLFIEDFTPQGDDVYTVYDPCRPYTYQIAICRNDGKYALVYYRDYEVASDAIIPPCGGGCVPDCAGKVCGDDGCGGSCGTCSTGYTCSNGQCVQSCSCGSWSSWANIGCGQGSCSITQMQQRRTRTCTPAGCNTETEYQCVTDVSCTCTPNWQCTSWSPSTCPSSCTQTRTCTDSNSCGTTSGKPAESQSCTGGSCPTICPANICNDSLITYNELILGLNKWIG